MREYPSRETLEVCFWPGKDPLRSARSAVAGAAAVYWVADPRTSKQCRAAVSLTEKEEKVKKEGIMRYRSDLQLIIVIALLILIHIPSYFFFAS